MRTTILAETIELIEGTLNTEQKTVDVVLIRPGWSQNGRYYAPDVLAKSASLFEGVKAYANHPTRDQLKRGDSRSVLDITGDYTNVRLGEAGELRATRHVYGRAGEAIWPLIERSVDTGRDIIGISINALGKAAKGKAPDGKQGEIVESIEIANSADDVDNPAAGGKFESLLMSGGDSLVTDLLQTITEEELTQARPDLVEAMRSQMKRARQDDAVRARTKERDAAQTALNDMTAQREELTTQIEAMRASNARLQHQVVLEKAFREADFTQRLEALIRKRLNEAEPEQWASIISDERAKLRAAGIKPAPVAVHGAPLQETRVVTVEQPAPATDVIDMNIHNTPEKFKAEMQRRATMRM